MPTTTDIKSRLRSDPTFFNAKALGRPGYWSKQREIAESVRDHPVTLVPSGNAVGKSFVAAGIIHWYLFTRPKSLVLATAPTQVQLAEVLWKEVERAYRGARLPLGGRLLRQPLKVDLGGGWQALAYSTTSVERFSGHHAGHVLVVCDESSGIEEQIFEAISSLNPSRELLLGNPLRPDDRFALRCEKARLGEPDAGNLIHISSFDSPHIHLERSPVGLADATFIRRSRADYGEGSLWWKSHVLGEFPAEGKDQVIPAEWLLLAEKAPRKPGGITRMAIDLGLGNGGDRSVIVVRDDNVLLEMWWSNMAPMEKTAGIAKQLCYKWGIPNNSSDISYDVEGIGADFANRLFQVGILNPTPYRGGNPGGPKHNNLRSYAAWRLRQRLDPDRLDPLTELRTPFHIPSEYLRVMRRELVGLRYENDLRGKIKLEDKKEFVVRLGHSPDFADAFTQAFGFGSDPSISTAPPAQTPSWQWGFSRQAPGY